MDDRLKKIDEKLNKINKKVDDIGYNQLMHQEFSSFKKEIMDLKTKLDTIMQEGKEVEKRIKYLEAENQVLKKDAKEMHAAIQSIIYDTKASELEIAGIKNLSGKSLKGLVKDIALKAGELVEDNDVLIVEQLQKRNGQVGSIHVVFKEKKKRDEFFIKVKKSRMKGKDLGMNDTNNIYVNDCLSRYMKSLLYQVKQFRITEKYKFVWVKNGKIFIRKTEKDNAILITCEEDLCVLKKC